MNSKTPEQKEEQVIHLTETWMHKNSRLFRMPWLVLPANVSITPQYAIRYFFAMLARVTLMYVLFFSTCTSISIAIDQRLRSFYGKLFSVANPLSSADARYMIDGFWHMGLLLLFFALFLCIAFTTPLAQYASHWNRRARRLQADPPTPPAPIPGVWPPPPNVVD